MNVIIYLMIDLQSSHIVFVTVIVKKTPLSSAERQRLYRKRRDSDPVKRQLYLQELKARYHKKSKAGKTKLVKNMTAEEHREMKEKWKYFKQKERAKMREQLKVKMFGHQTVTDDQIKREFEDN